MAKLPQAKKVRINKARLYIASGNVRFVASDADQEPFLERPSCANKASSFYQSRCQLEALKILYHTRKRTS
jgi:hypothetical protein